MTVPAWVLWAVVTVAIGLPFSIADRLKKLHDEVDRLRRELMDVLYPGGSTRTTDNHLARTHEELSGIAFTLDEIRKHLVDGPYVPPEPP